MGLLERVAAERKSWSGRTWHFGGGQGFVQPPFWNNLEAYRTAFGGYLQPDRERIENDFEGYVEGAYKSDGIVFACILTRQLVFQQATFQWTNIRGGQPGPLFGSPELGLLERPWVNGITADLLARMEVDLSLAGNFYATTADDLGRVGRSASGEGLRVSHLRPDWVTIVVSSRSGDPRAADARIVAYVYEPPPSTRYETDPVVLVPEEVVHYAMKPDPLARYRGMSWLTPVLREISADRAATTHKLKFFEQGASLGTVVTLAKEISPEAFTKFVELFKEQHQGTENAYRPLFFGGGADVTVTGADLQQLDFKATQGAGETRIAAASGVGAIVAQFSEGMQGSSLNAGNYGAARRRVSDVLFRPMWAKAAGSLATLVPPPASSPGARLWPDLRGVFFLQEDQRDAADIQFKESQTIRQLIDAGYKPESVVAAVRSGDWTKLDHTGLFSVQLQRPGQSTPPADQPAPNGNGSARVPVER